MNFEELKNLLRSQDAAFWEQLKSASLAAHEFDQLFLLSTLRKKALAKGLVPTGNATASLRIALIGGCSLYPFRELLEHFLAVQEIPHTLFVGDFDNYISEITEPDSPLYHFKPQVVLLLPSLQRCRYSGKLSDPTEQQQTDATAAAQQILALARTLHERTQAEVILANFMLPANHDPGSFRSRTLGSDWNYRKWVNLQMGLNAPAFVHICDLEFLAYRRGGIQSMDESGWFESKQLCSPALLVDFSREVAHLVASLRRPSKKLLILDLDNTLWGGVVADDGLEGIEIGDTSPRGEAFKAFQKYILSLQERGILLAVCSKNDHQKALQPFEKHPEMVIRLKNLVSFKANWEPKSENIRSMSSELNLGLDSFVFVDDNPAEIDIVNQFVPQVTTILLGADPATYVSQLKDSRLFEPGSLTAEDAQRTEQYQSEGQRLALLASVTNMNQYLESLQMEATIAEFNPLDVPRLAQLINKSNQFNLTTRRRTEAEVTGLMDDPAHACFSIRLADRFGDHGLIAIVVGQVKSEIFEIDTWLMSCRVLKRQVEEETVNEILRLAGLRGCTRVKGVYLRTPKNEMVLDLYPKMGFKTLLDNHDRREFEMSVNGFQSLPTKIKVVRRAYESK
jgi:FkbH-like protein